MRTIRVALVAVGVGFFLASGGCGGIRGTPTGRGWSAFRVGGLTVELPEGWTAKGDASRIAARSPDGMARMEAERVERPFATGGECLTDAERSAARWASSLERPRHHPTRIGERAAVVMEGDRGGWHGWAWAACDGRQQYRLSFYGASPMSAEAIHAQRALEASVRFDGQ